MNAQLAAKQLAVQKRIANLQPEAWTELTAYCGHKLQFEITPYYPVHAHPRILDCGTAADADRSFRRGRKMGRIVRR
jgi:hypothetical protein